MTHFAIGCTHFGHGNILRLANRPFSSIEEHDETLIENWNKTVGKRDTVFHLGDVAWGSQPHNYLHRLNGNIQVIKGNHDRHLPWPSVKQYLHCKIGKTNVIMFHFPIEEWDGWWRGSIHLHAHTHKAELRSAERRFNVGADAVGFTPIAIEELVG